MTTLTVPDPRLIPEVSGYVEYLDGDTYRLKPHPCAPRGHVFCAWFAELYKDASHIPAENAWLTIAEHQRMLDCRRWVAGVKQADPEQVRREQVLAELALYAHPDFVAHHRDAYLSGERTEYIDGLLDGYRQEQAYAVIARANREASEQDRSDRDYAAWSRLCDVDAVTANFRQPFRREDFSFKPDTESNDYQGWTF